MDLRADLDLQQPPKPSEGLTVLSLNLHCLKTEGTAYGSNGARFAAVADLVQKEQVQLILAQEVCENKTESAQKLLLASLMQKTGQSWQGELAFTHLSFAGTKDEADEHVWLFAPVVPRGGRGPLRGVQKYTYRAQGGLARVAISARYGELLLYSVHLDHQEAARRTAQARETATHALWQADPEPAILVAGDLNARPGSEPAQAFAEQGFLDAAATLTKERIDHVLIHRGTPLSASGAELVFQGSQAVSDHPGVLVRFKSQQVKAPTLTRIRTGAEGTLSIRGSVAPLSWAVGLPVFVDPDGRKRFVASEIPSGAFGYKLLRDDRDWQLGDNVIGQGEMDNQVTPQFP